ncbi:hypothetical protein Anas_14122 [Armadillidium nasatum]|uniref:Uncharacterized protein n=1 Tax=Armadillidium nasatum TaxID=96803 RepID=A0A5N5T3X7_9CRUS|nr:hypothetical protein Anas_14122 [Armadillidium nasatum]
MINLISSLNTIKFIVFKPFFHPSKNLPLFLSKLYKPNPPNTSTHPKSSFLNLNLKYILLNLSFIPLIFGKFHIVINTSVSVSIEENHNPFVFQKHNQTPKTIPNSKLVKDSHFDPATNLTIQGLGIHTHNKNAPLTSLNISRNIFEINIIQSSSSLLIYEL